MPRTRAVVFAYHDVGVRCLRVLVEHGVEVELIVTHQDDPNENVWFPSVSTLARSLGIDVLLDPTAVQLPPHTDFIFSFYYRRMLPQAVLERAQRGAFNMHGSLLPKYRGRAPVNWAVLHGETQTGATLHEMTEKPDAGRIVGQEQVAIGPDELAIDVFRKVSIAAELVMRRSIGPLIAGKATLTPQDLSKGSYFGARRPQDGRIDWSKPAREIHNLVRAVAPPYPGAFDDQLKIHRTRVEESRTGPNALGPYQDDGGEWFAVCGDGKVLRLLEVEPRDEKAEKK
ncbi:MAG: formyltransferase [Betaproteobacteria bacterium]